MAKGSRMQIMGTEQKISQNPAVESPSANPRSGQFQLVGTDIQMGRSSIQSPSANPKEGTRTVIGDKIAMSRAPVKGWGNAAPLTMSERAHRQSKTAAGGGSGRTKR